MASSATSPTNLAPAPYAPHCLVESGFRTAPPKMTRSGIDIGLPGEKFGRLQKI
jgi:hypothetical protein